MSSVGKDPNWINFADSTPTLQFVECGGRVGEERAALFHPDRSDDGEWISAREDIFIEVGGRR